MLIPDRSFYHILVAVDVEEGERRQLPQHAIVHGRMSVHDPAMIANVSSYLISVILLFESYRLFLLE